MKNAHLKLQSYDIRSTNAEFTEFLARPRPIYRNLTCLLNSSSKLVNGEYNHTPTTRIAHKLTAAGAVQNTIPISRIRRRKEVHMWLASLFRSSCRSSLIYFHRGRIVTCRSTMCRPLIPGPLLPSFPSLLFSYAVIFNGTPCSLRTGEHTETEAF